MIPTLTRFARAALVASAACLLVACAHPINLAPYDMPARDQASLVNKRVAYVMTDADRDKQITSAAGGGDKVSYFPYRELEKSIRDALRSIYEDVDVVRSTSEAAPTVSYTFDTQIITNSSSESVVTWPPTRFSIQYVCSVTDAKGLLVTQLRVTGSGAAEYSEFKNDFSLAGKRAAKDANEQLVKEIRANQQLR